MTDIPQSVRDAVDAALAELPDPDSPFERDRWRIVSRVTLEAATPLLAEGLREHIDTDHLVMVQLGLLADAAVKMLEHVNMDTDEDRELHARAVGALRARLDEMAATMKEANEAAREDEGHG